MNARERAANVSVWALTTGRLQGCRRAIAPAAAVLLVLGLGACSSAFGTRQIFMPALPKQTEPVSAAAREHQRVLAAYGGAYEDPRLQAKLGDVVDRLVASSEQPEVPYKVTILNSPAVNAFALPSGQLYVTRGLLGLANDSAEIASVMSHEM